MYGSRNQSNSVGNRSNRKIVHLSAGKKAAGAALARFRQGAIELKPFLVDGKHVHVDDIPIGSSIVIHSPTTGTLASTVLT